MKTSDQILADAKELVADIIENEHSIVIGISTSDGKCSVYASGDSVQVAAIYGRITLQLQQVSFTRGSNTKEL